MPSSLISICIPCYNSDVTALCKNLVEQIKKDALEIEIVVIDDASKDEFKVLNKDIVDFSPLRYIALEENIGRARIRNEFLKYAKAEYFLFVDGDSAVPSNFLKKYSEYLQNQSRVDVLVGASVYQNHPPERAYRLRWKYSRKRESLSFSQRISAQNGGFKSNNFLIRKDVFAQIPFNEKILGYGHEDTLFGHDLAKNNISISHIDNPVVNIHLDSNEVFLEKTKNAVRNSVAIYEMLENSSDWVKSQKLLSLFLRLNKSPFGRLLLKVNFLNRTWYLASLRSGRAPLVVFDLYRLALMSEVKSL